MKDKERSVVDQEKQQIPTTSSEYSRTQRSGRQEKVALSMEEAPKTKIKVPSQHKFYIALMSLLVSVISIALPIFSGLASTQQSENLYIGFMMSQGTYPYSEIYASSGIIYYALLALSYLGGTLLLTIPIYFLAHYISGIYIYKLMSYLTPRDSATIALTSFFYVLLATFGFGGLYASQLALPFILVSIWFLLRYFKQEIPDETFMIYGLTGAIAILIEPRSLVFWLLSVIFIGIYNLRNKHIARGFYQLLCVLFGNLLVFYIAGYFVLNMQSVSAYLEQTGWNNFVQPALSDGSLVFTIGLQLLMIFSSGLVFWGLKSLISLKSFKEDKWFCYLMLCSSVCYLIYAIFSRTYDLSQLILFLPFGLVLSAPYLNETYEVVNKKQRRSHRVTKTSRSFFTFIFKSFYYLPVVMVIYAMAAPVVSYASSYRMSTERDLIATYLKKEVGKDDTIYVWDSQATVYIKSQTSSSSLYPLPFLAARQSSYQKELEDNLLSDKATYVIQNKKMALSDAVKQNLAKNYEKISLDQVEGFVVYKLK